MENIAADVESTRPINEEEKDTREKEEKEEIVANLEFKSIDILEAKLAKRIVEKWLMENISVEFESSRIMNEEEKASGKMRGIEKNKRRRKLI